MAAISGGNAWGHRVWTSDKKSATFDEGRVAVVE